MATETIVAHLFHREAPKKAEQKKDKLAETKKQEALVKQAFKAGREEQKKDKEEEIHAAAEAFRMERSWNPISKRAQKDARHQAKHEAKIAEGQMCEHGIWKCRICFPHKNEK